MVPLGLVAQHLQYFGGAGLACLAAEVDVLCHRGLRVPELVSGRSCCQSGVVMRLATDLRRMCEVIPSYPARLKASRRSLRVFAGSRRVPISVENTTSQPKVVGGSVGALWDGCVRLIG